MKLNSANCFYLLILVASFWSCSENEKEPVCENSYDRGKLLETSFMLAMEQELISANLASHDFPVVFEAANSIEIYKLTYQTIDPWGNIITASGALFVPLVQGGSPLISIQHGTVINRNRVASRSPLYAPDGILLSANGYLACVPDYIGLGESPGFHPYLHESSSAAAVVDFLRAVRIFCCQNDIELNDQIFLMGYSEGGYVTLAAQKAIELNYTSEFNLTASAPMAGPYDLLYNAKTILTSDTYLNPAYIGYTLFAYDNIYSMNNIDSIFNSDYASRLPELYNGNYTASEINSQLTTSMSSLFDSTFLAEFRGNGQSELKQLLAMNSPVKWGPATPTRLYHGSNDSTVSVINAFRAYDSLTFYGATDIQLHIIEGADHLTAVFPVFEKALTWIDSLTVRN